MTPVRQLSDALEQLYSAARLGDLASFSRLAETLTAALDELEVEQEDEADLLRISLRATEVARMLEASEQGLAAARRRLAEIRAVRIGQGTYGGDGRRRSLTMPRRDSKRI